jgi:hypothetical protein
VAAELRAQGVATPRMAVDDRHTAAGGEGCRWRSSASCLRRAAREVELLDDAVRLGPNRL